MGFPIDVNHLSFASTDFSTLMQKRIYRILIVCSNYDFYILEEDGRIEEQIFNEYNALNFRFPPVVLHADSEEKASLLLSTVDIDLVIYMINPHQTIPDTWLREVKQLYPHVPVVMLVYFSHTTAAIIERIESGLIDHIFCWQGNADLLVAIIKLLEDSINAPHDILQVGTQAILVIEDSIQYLSIMLPMLYKIVVWQSQELAKEGLNEHQKMLRLRGRPKILLGKTFDDAMQLYNRYASNILGIITDVDLQSYPIAANEENSAGVKFAGWVRSHDPFLPILLQSSDSSNQKFASKLQAGFIDKQSKTLANDYKKYIATHFGFGDFVFRTPLSGDEFARASDLYELQHTILNIPDEIFAFHARRNDFSKWLNARALFGLGKIFRNLQLTDFSNNIPEAKKFVYEAIAQYRISKGRGVIARYERQEFDQYVTFSRIGTASIGGKGRGLAFADSILKKNPGLNRFEHVTIEIPRTVVVATDVFDEFMELNHINPSALAQVSNDEILSIFLQAHLPEHVMIDLQHYLQWVNRPLAIRSSSKLEDSQLLPFAGIYKTYMIPNTTNKSHMLNMLCDAIKCVYASVFYTETRTYFQSTGNNLSEEKMAVILQEVCGQKCCNYYFPLVSGVALSYNFYPIPPETVSDGVAHIACGLGKYVVEGGQCLRFSPRHPQRALIFSSTELQIKNVQKTIYALSLDPASWHPTTDDKVNLIKLSPDDLLNHPGKALIASKYNIDNQLVIDNLLANGKTIITFHGILKHHSIPLPEILTVLLTTFEEEMHAPVELEFALEVNSSDTYRSHFYLLQVRPLSLRQQSPDFDITDIPQQQKIIAYSSHALGNGVFSNLRDVVYVIPENFDAAATVSMAKEIEHYNFQLRQLSANYLLIGPGRWGSSDPWLGIPVRWHQISNAQVIVEEVSDNHPIDFSQGSHLFYNLVSRGVAFLMIDRQRKPEVIDYELLRTAHLVEERKYTRWVRFDKPLTVWVDGRKNKGIILH